MGPYTSRIMTECLEREAVARQIPVFNHMQLIQLLVREEKVEGALCLNTGITDHGEFVLIWCENVVLATGGPAGMYHDSVIRPRSLAAAESPLRPESGEKI